MPPKTLTDQVRELYQYVSALDERVKILGESVRDSAKLIREAENRLARLEESTRFAEHDRRERSSRSSFFWIAVVSTILGAIVGSLMTFGLQRFFP